MQKRLLRFISTFSLVFSKCNLLFFRLIVIHYLLLSPPEAKANLYPIPNNRLAFVSFNSGLTDEILWSILRRGCQNLKSLDLSLSPHFLTEFAILCIGKSHINVPFYVRLTVKWAIKSDVLSKMSSESVGIIFLQS